MHWLVKLFPLVLWFPEPSATLLSHFRCFRYNTDDTVLASPILTKVVTLGCVGMIGAIDTAYLSWLLFRAQHHTRAWNKWRRKNSVVKVILAPPESFAMGKEDGQYESDSSLNF